MPRAAPESHGLFSACAAAGMGLPPIYQDQAGRLYRAAGHRSNAPVQLRVGISSCLLGLEVRYDGGHKRDPFLTDMLGRFVEWVPVCPEMELGLGVPRESIRLEGTPDAPRLVGVKSRTDHTAAMARLACTRVDALARQDLVGYVLKTDSPSCGMARVRVYGDGGPPARSGLVQFHTVHELALLAHDPAAYRRLGVLVAQAKARPLRAVLDDYGDAFMAALRVRATLARHANVLEHMLGYFSKDLAAAECREMVDTITDHRRGFVPLIVPLTLVKHHVRRLGIEYLAEQTYLGPHPKELTQLPEEREVRTDE